MVSIGGIYIPEAGGELHRPKKYAEIITKERAKEYSDFESLKIKWSNIEDYRVI